MISMRAQVMNWVWLILAIMIGALLVLVLSKYLSAAFT